MARPKTIASTYVRCEARLPKGLLRLLRMRARASGAPLNTEIIHALRRGLCDKPERPTLPEGHGGKDG